PPPPASEASRPAPPPQAAAPRTVTRRRRRGRASEAVPAARSAAASRAGPSPAPHHQAPTTTLPPIRSHTPPARVLQMLSVSTTDSPREAAVAIENLIQLLRERAVDQPDRVLLRFFRDGAWRDWTYGRVLHRVEAIAGGLEMLGVRPGDRAAILSGARPEWILADLGSMAAGAVVLGIDPELPEEETACILDHVEARVAFVEDWETAMRITGTRHRAPTLEHVILLEGEATGDPAVLSLQALESLAAPGRGAIRLDRTARRAREAPATICYTAGTTGLPKGALLTHGNLIGALAASARAFADALRPIEQVLCPVAPSSVL